jgi:hypothetical protein
MKRLQRLQHHQGQRPLPHIRLVAHLFSYWFTIGTFACFIWDNNRAGRPVEALDGVTPVAQGRAVVSNVFST